MFFGARTIPVYPGFGRGFKNKVVMILGGKLSGERLIIFIGRFKSFYNT
jgi:hypothetical protein